MSERQPTSAGGQASLDRLLVALRPKLHRYCARMTGSVIDGEDVVQDALAKAITTAPDLAGIDNPEGWLFRIAHNAALDHLRRRAHREINAGDEEIEMTADPADAFEDRRIVAAGLRTFMRLPAAQRSSVILMDVLGYSLLEIGDITGATIAAVKAQLHRGREALLRFAEEPDDATPPVLDAAQGAMLAAYIDRFNARDFDAIRDMLADEVRLDLVARASLGGRKDVGGYVSNYARASDWRFTAGSVEGRPAILVARPDDPSHVPSYFILIEWDDGRIISIRDFRYAQYVMEAADVRLEPDRAGQPPS